MMGISSIKVSYPTFGDRPLIPDPLIPEFLNLYVRYYRTDLQLILHFFDLPQVNKTDWVRHGRPAVVNAFYSPLENSIQFPAGILQGIFFSNERPRLVQNHQTKQEFFKFENVEFFE